MKMKGRYRRPYVQLTSYWGNDDAESTIKVGPKKWKEIQEGAEYSTSAWGWYEGRRFSVFWRFSDGKYSIDGEDFSQCVLDSDVTELIVEKWPEK